MKRKQSALAATFLLLVIMGMGCDPSVDPFQENELAYSIFGYLNASADTQFVRVEPLRDGMLTRAPGSLDVDVTLTDLTTDQTTSLRDSLFRYLDGATAHNFYTTSDIEPTTPYRLTARGSDGAESYAQTTVPDTFPAPTVVTPIAEEDLGFDCNNPYLNSQRTVVEIRGIERLVAVRALYYAMETVRSYGHLADTVQTENDVIEARVNYVEDLCRIPETNAPQRIEIVVAAGNPDWPDFMRLDWETETLPGVASNVEGGTGLLGGVVTDTVVVHPYYED